MPAPTRSTAAPCAVRTTWAASSRTCRSAAPTTCAAPAGAASLPDPDAVTAQIATAADSGLLDALVLSGASDREGPYSGPWIDAHHPFASIDPDAASLLTDDRVRAAVRAAGDARLRGVKVSRRPGATASEALESAHRHLAAVRAAEEDGTA